MSRPRNKLLTGLGVVLVAGIGAILLFRPGFEEVGCACVPPPSIEEVNALIEMANASDTEESVLAHGKVWQAYRERKDKANEVIWRKKAIEIAEPNAIASIAEGLMFSVHNIKGERYKIRKMREALYLLEKSYARRALLRGFQSVYVNKIRAARGSIAVAEGGLEHWEIRANNGDATAAHNLAAYYFYFQLDQNNRSYWEKRSAELGDPTFAWKEACCWRETEAEIAEGKKYILAAEGNAAAWKGVGDSWMQGILAAELDAAEIQLDRRLLSIRQTRATAQARKD